MRAQLLQLCPALCDPKAIACQTPLSMGFSRQEYWSGLPCPLPGNLPDPGTEPAIQETRVQSLGHKDPLEEGMASHSSILAWRIPWTEEPDEAVVHSITKSWTRLND